MRIPLSRSYSHVRGEEDSVRCKQRAVCKREAKVRNQAFSFAMGFASTTRGPSIVYLVAMFVRNFE